MNAETYNNAVRVTKVINGIKNIRACNTSHDNEFSAGVKLKEKEWDDSKMNGFHEIWIKLSDYPELRAMLEEWQNFVSKGTGYLIDQILDKLEKEFNSI